MAVPRGQKCCSSVASTSPSSTSTVAALAICLIPRGNCYKFSAWQASYKHMNTLCSTRGGGRWRRERSVLVRGICTEVSSLAHISRHDLHYVLALTLARALVQHFFSIQPHFLHPFLAPSVSAYVTICAVFFFAATVRHFDTQ